MRGVEEKEKSSWPIPARARSPSRSHHETPLPPQTPRSPPSSGALQCIPVHVHTSPSNAFPALFAFNATCILAVALASTITCTIPATRVALSFAVSIVSCQLSVPLSRPPTARCSGGGRRRPRRGQPSHHSNHSALAEHRGEGWRERREKCGTGEKRQTGDGGRETSTRSMSASARYLLRRHHQKPLPSGRHAPPRERSN